jgi:hypothetical protein
MPRVPIQSSSHPTPAVKYIPYTKCSKIRILPQRVHEIRTSTCSSNANDPRHQERTLAKKRTNSNVTRVVFPALKFISVGIRNAPEIRNYTSSSSSTELRGIRTSTYSYLKAERNEKDSDGARMIRIRKLSDLEISTERSFFRDRRHILLIVGEKQTWVLEAYQKP